MIDEYRNILDQKSDIALQEITQKIKSISVSSFDEIANPIVVKVTDEIDCTLCGNCCRKQEPGVTEDEMRKLADASDCSLNDFKDKYIAWDKDGVSFMATKPCLFLHENKCTVYSIRPNSCADYPGLHRKALKWRWKQVMYNYSICPIVVKFVEELNQKITSHS